MRLRHDAAERPAADREKLCAVIADSLPDPPRGHPAADAARLFEHDHAAAGRREFAGGHEPGDARAHDRHVDGLHGLAHGAGKSSRIGSLAQGIRLEASTSPAAQPAMMPAVSAIARTRGKTWAFSGGNCDL